MFYAGIGSRESPEDVLMEMYDIAHILAQHNFVLRSGGAQGADTAFEQGCDLAGGRKQIFIPWRGFTNNPSHIVPDILEEAWDIAEEHHPAWNRCSIAAKKLHTRNVYQVLGQDCNTHSSFVVCWTKNGGLNGGTAQALRIATTYRIPIVNLYHRNWQEKLKGIVNSTI